MRFEGRNATNREAALRRPMGEFRSSAEPDLRYAALSSTRGQAGRLGGGREMEDATVGDVGCHDRVPIHIRLL